VDRSHLLDDDAGGVATLRWPDQRPIRDERIAHGSPCLLLIEPGIDVPEIDAVLEDWTLTTATVTEMNARRDALVRRVAVLPHDPVADAEPTIDLDDVLRVGDHSLVLAPIEARLLRTFLDDPGAIITKESLMRSTWPDGAPRSNSFTVRLARLRKRLRPFRMSILTFPRRGYMLVLHDDEARTPSS
jgi:DNA-binding response OmpR family regulator